MTTALEQRIERLSAVAAGRVIDPDVDVAGEIGPGQVIPDELLTTFGLDVDLSADQRARLSREEVASIFRSGIGFEALLNAGFSVQIALARDVTDPRITFLLHEIGEETRHQRLFQRVITQLEPQAVGSMRWIDRLLERVGPHFVISMPALLLTIVLGGEEIPDLIQKQVAEHPDTDPFLASVNRYHRAEEARHLSFAKAVFQETWEQAGALDRFAVRYVAPLLIRDIFRFLVHPGVYTSIGLPPETWAEVQQLPARVALRHEATRPVLDTLVDAGVFGRRGIPSAWSELCGVAAGSVLPFGRKRTATATPT
jgi:hypothetical protein